MKKRLFFALPLSSGFIKKIGYLEKEIDKKIKIKWLPLENLHLTLCFLGYIEINYLPLIIHTFQNLFSHSELNKIIKLKIEKIGYGPPGKKRMIWLYVAKNKKLEEIKNHLENSLTNLGIIYQKENRNFLPHINLARLKNFSQDKLPEISKFLNWEVFIKEINLYESYLKKPYAHYEVLSSVKLFSS
ncbi:MAG: RNA 2',3'-cyclic phosphodiesterase [Patescibacteria group bacterium]|nr:RNA 2',3'-cyclic phosphodiesterase [Patescibacteria group bacterium]